MCTGAHACTDVDLGAQYDGSTAERKGVCIKCFRCERFTGRTEYCYHCESLISICSHDNISIKPVPFFKRISCTRVYLRIMLYATNVFYGVKNLPIVFSKVFVAISNHGHERFRSQWKYSNPINIVIRMFFSCRYSYLNKKNLIKTYEL